MQEGTRASAAATSAAGPAAFSLVLGGPLFQLMRRGRLCNDVMGLVQRRVVTAIAVTWLPLLALSALQGSLWGAGRTLPFLNDIESHLRFLLVVPLLIVAELIVHQRIQPLIDQFRIRNLVRSSDAARFADALGQALRLRNSLAAEVAMIALVYAVGVPVIWKRYALLHTDAWYLAAAPARDQVSLAGLWLVFVSVPIFQFLLLRWYFRMFIWGRLLFRLSLLDLDLKPTHSDEAGGLGFLGASLNAFVPIALAHGFLLAGMISDRIFYGGAKLTDFELEIVAAVVILLVVFASPLAVFAPLLARVKRTGLREYGALAQSYVRAFDDKWLRGGAPADEPLIGSADIQSLADLSNSFSVVERMRIIPLSRMALVQFVIAIVAPILPLVLTMTSVEKLIEQLLGLVL